MNPYEVLGVEKSASTEEIKKAYRKLAKEHHPDVNSDENSAQKFKEIAAAFEILGDESKRKNYDTYGDANPRRRGNPFQGGFDSFFEEIFNQGRRRVYKGQNIRITIECTLEEAFFGYEKDIEYMKKELCSSCKGSGAKKKTECRTCKGSGVFIQQNGPMAIQSTCHICHGSGSMIEEVCETCQGVGLTGKRNKIVSVKIPAGVDTGMHLSFKGEGEPYPSEDGINGDLFIAIEVKPHDFFMRSDDNLLCIVPMHFSELVLGCKKQIKSLGGEMGEFSIPAGTQTGTKFRLRGKGMPILNNNKRYGDIIAMVEVEIPKVDKPDKEIFSQLSLVESKYNTEKRNYYDQYMAKEKEN